MDAHRVASRIALAASALLLSLVAAEAHAEGLDGQRFVPAAGAAGGFHVERPLVPKHLGWGLGAFLSYGHRPVVVLDRATDRIVATPLQNALALDAVGSIGLFNFMELAAHIPIRPLWKGDDITASGERLNAGAGLGDIRLIPKFGFLDRGTESFHWSLGAMLPVSLPTGSGTHLRGADAVTLEPRLLLGIGGNKWDWIFSGGYAARTANNNLMGKSEITFGTAFTLGVHKKVDLQAEIYGAHLPDATTRGSKTPLESLLGVIIKPNQELEIYLGAGPGITSGIGTPDFRLVGGIRFGHKVPRSDRFGDDDHDGVKNGDDQCPDQKEDDDGYQDEDGCPDPDNDHDGVLDEVDECPEAAEEPGGNGDGCPAKGRVIVENGEIHIFGKVQFDTGSSNVAKKSEPILDDMAKVLKDHPEFKSVEIGGHTDDTGPKEVNEKLSEQRAESVKKELIKRGVSADRLKTKGYGPSEPISPNTTAPGRARNRRVEFKVEH